jgi:penicillin amidase
MVDETYPHHLGSDFLPPYRARRVTRLLTETERHTAETFARMQADTVSLPAREICDLLTGLEPGTDRQKEALALLAGWDHDLAADSAAAALYEVWCMHISRRVLLRILDPELFEHFYARRQWTNGFQYRVLPHVLAYPSARWFGRDGVDARDEALRGALDDALDELTGRLGDEMAEWRWGALHRARFASRLAIVPDLAELFTAGVIEVGGDEQTVNQALFEPGVPYEVVVMPSWRQILDPSDWDACLGAHTLGQSGNVESPHYRDQLELWSAVRHHAMPFTEEAVARETAAELRLLP